jgi:CheY-like chemotaxis protein
MKKILFVEDNALIAGIYSQKLAEVGFEVVVAEDGLEAMKKLTEFKPDLVVLDLMMPKLTGADVLKFMRQHAELKFTRVIVFSNSFLSDLVEQISSMAVERTLVKAAVNPARLVEVINQVLAAPSQASAAAQPVGIPVAEPATIEPPAAAPAIPVVVVAKAPGAEPKKEPDPEFLTRVEREFLDRAPNILKELRQMCREFVEATDSPALPERILALNRKLGFLIQMAGMAGYHRTAELCSALEALLFELLNKPAQINDSSLHTVAATVAFLADRFDRARLAAEQPRPPAAILVVDDDAVSNRAVQQALGRAKLSATGVTDPFEALQKLEAAAYHVVLLDISMPGMDGLALCERMRELPHHQQTAVIFVTSYTDFKTRARSILSGGNDLITKPISPTELCVKVITHLLKAG